MKILPALLAILVCASLPIHAASLADLTYTTTNGKVTITDCDEAATGELVIPNTIQGNPVVSIGEEAFERCQRLTRVTIPEGVIDIGRRAFVGLTSLVQITLPQSLIQIGQRAFEGCRNLRDLSLPRNLFSINECAFFRCDSLEHITIPDSVLIVEPRAFESCSNLKEITFGNNVLNIANFVCCSCWSLETVTFRNNPPNIGASAFRDCKKLSEISIPTSVTEIESFAFSGASDLRKINLPDGLTAIYELAFNDCSSLKRIIIPPSITQIGRAFEGCYDLHSLIFLGPAPLWFPFNRMTDGTTVYIQSEHQDSFGGNSGEWFGFPVKIGNGPSTPPVRIHFPTVEGATYRMQNSTDLVNWSNYPFPVVGNSDNRYDRFVDPRSRAKIFYRLIRVD